MPGSLDPLPTEVRGPKKTDMPDGAVPVVAVFRGESSKNGAGGCRITCTDALWRLQTVHRADDGSERIIGSCGLPAGTHLAIPSFLGPLGGGAFHRVMIVLQLSDQGTRSFVYDLPAEAGGPRGPRGILVMDVVRAMP